MKRPKSSKPVRHKLSKPGVEPFTRREKHMIAITEQNQRDSPLLRLPAELRNKIYEYVLSEGDYPIEVSPKENGRNRIVISTSVPNRLAILGVCQQTYNEAALLPFTLNVFILETLWVLLTIKDCFTFPQRRAIKYMRIKVSAILTFKELHDVQHYQGRNHRSLSAYIPGAKDVLILFRVPLSSSILGGDEFFEKEKDELKSWLRGDEEGVNVVLKYGYDGRR